jgi:hypothetical protein
MYSWTEVSTYLADVQEMGVHIVRIAGNNTLTDTFWATLQAAGFDVLYCANEVATRTKYRSDDDYITAYLSFIDTVLNRYGPNGSYLGGARNVPYRPLQEISISNEPNSYGTGTAAEKAALYAQLLVAAYAHIKAKWPKVTVVGFEASDASAAAPGFISQVFASDPRAAQAFDVMAVHPYTRSQAPDGTITEEWGSWDLATNMHNVRHVMDAYGVGDKPIWFTETGYKISNNDGGRYIDSSGTVSPELQAAYNLRMDMVAAANGVQRVYHMFVTDTDNYNYGYWQSPGNPRPVAIATATMNKYLQGVTKLEIVKDGSSNVFYYRFTTPRGRVGVAWATKPTASTLTLVGGATKIVGVLGNLVGTTSATSYSGSLGESPTFFVELTDNASASPSG